MGGGYNINTIGASIINALAEVPETKTCVIQDSVYDKLTDEQKSVAASKNWQIDRYPILGPMGEIGFKIYDWMKWEGEFD